METIHDYLYNREEIIFAYLYGSVARGTANKISDIDIAVYVDENKKPAAGVFGYRSELITELKSLTARKVDLIILNNVSLLLAFNVLKDGKLLFTKSNEVRVSFHETIMSKYLDFLPMIKVQERYLKNRLTEGNYGR